MYTGDEDAENLKFILPVASESYSFSSSERAASD
jgi:hypothetical protein